MGTQILRNTKGIPTPQRTFRKYVRPEEWLDLPTLTQGDEVIHMLIKVYEEGGNWLGLNIEGDYEVDWGDGTTTTHSSGTVSEHDIQWSGVSSSTLTSFGYRQAIVTITPQAGSSLTEMSSAAAPSDPSHRNNVVDIRMAAPNMVDMRQAFSTYINLELFEFVGTNMVSDVTLTFSGCYNLKKVTQFDMSNATLFDSTFSGCESLIEVPDMKITNPVRIALMFRDCLELEYIPPMDCTNVTLANNAFEGCTKLKNNPIYNTQNITNIANIFRTCRSLTYVSLDLSSATLADGLVRDCEALQKVEILNPENVSITSSSFMFWNCVALTEVTPFDTSNSTNMLYMFNNCGLNDISWVNVTSACTNLQYAFHSNYIDKLPETIDISGLNSTSDLTFLSRGSRARKLPTFTGILSPSVDRLDYLADGMRYLEELPLFDTSNVTRALRMLYNCQSLREIPAYDLSSLTVDMSTTWAYNCYNLRRSRVTGITVTHTYFNCQLDRDAIVEIFNNLGTVTGKTITITNNPGVTDLTPTDLAIATGKGWTVVS